MNPPPLFIRACVRSYKSCLRVKIALGDHAHLAEYTTSLDFWAEAARRSNVIILSIPPAELGSFASNSALCKAMKHRLIISLLAGTTCAQIVSALCGDNRSNLPDQYSVVHASPSMGAQNVDSITLIADTPHARTCDWLFEQIGTNIYISESLMNEATATNAICNALTTLAVDAITDAAVAEGLPRSKAMQLVAQSLRSAAGMIEDGVTPESIRESISTPKGITINALLDMEKGHIKPAVSDATRNAIRYTRNIAFT